MVLCRVILVDTPHSPSPLFTFFTVPQTSHLWRIFVTVTHGGSGVPNSFLQRVCTCHILRFPVALKNPSALLKRYIY
jgi:hypothetical protein